MAASLTAIPVASETLRGHGRTPAPLAKSATAAAPGNALALNAPSITIPLRFVLTGILALFLGVGLLWYRPAILAEYHYNQYVIATTHLFVLGWMSTVVMGAMYQLVPVALETHLYSERIARWQFVLHVVGFAGMVWMFWKWDMKQVGHYGSALAVGVGLFVFNIVRTLMRVPKWNVVATSVASALVWLSLTILAGLAVAAAKCSYEAANVEAGGVLGETLRALRSTATFVGRFDQMGVMHAHAHLGIVGVFLMLIVGVSYKLIPMFTLSDLQKPLRAAASVLLINLGLVGSFLTILLRSSWKPLFAVVVLAGLVLYGLEIRAILRARKRRNLDWGLKYFFTAISLLGPLGILGLVLSWPSLPLNPFTGQLENLYGFLAITGVVSFAILGMLYKVLPFLVWFGTYSRHIGTSKVPSLADLYSPKIQNAGYWLYLAALATAGAGIVLANGAVVRIGCTLLAASLVLFGVNVIKMLSHLWRPEINAR